MRSALALSALLLLLPPLPSLSNDGASTTGNLITALSPGDKKVPTTTKQVTTTASSGGDKKTASGSPAATTSDPKGVQGADQTTSTSTPTPTPTPTAVPTKTTVPTKTETTSSQNGIKGTAQADIQSSHSATTSIMTTKEGNQATPQPQVVNSPDTASAAPSSTTRADTQPLTLGPVISNPLGSSSEGPSKMTPASRGPGATTGGTITPQGTPATSTPLVTSQGSQQISTNVPAITGTLSSVTGTLSSVTGTLSSVTGTLSSVTGTFSSVTGTSSSKTPWLPVSSSGPVATPPVGTTSSSTHLAPTPPRDSNISSATPALETSRIRCEPPEKLNEKMLILNFTKTSLCTQKPETPLEDELVTLLCRAAKANFNPRQDQCHIRLVPVPESQAVAIKEITIQTNLLPQDVYESLKDKWDDLKEVGVSNMQLGDQGPPEETEDRFSMPLIITIVCMASFLLLVAALYGCCHQRLSQRKDQQRLTEELQTVENGYHDNPTLEVMETSSEMQEKKVVNLNGELGDSWIVPLDNLIKDDLDEEEDTHL